MIINRKINNIRLFNYIIAIIAFLASYYVNKNSYNVQGYEFYFLVPLIFGILLCFLSGIDFFNIKMIGPFILNITMVLKYIILPILACKGNYYSIYGKLPTENQLKLAVLFTIYELISICILSNILSKKIKYNVKLETNICKMIEQKILYRVIIAISIVVIIVLPETIADYRFIFDQQNLGSTIVVDFPMSGIFKTIVDFGRYSIVLILINLLYKRNKVKRSYVNILVSFLIVLINSLYISNLSRISLLVPILTFSILLIFLYNNPRERKIIFMLITTVFTVGLVYLSLVKFFGNGRGTINNSTNIHWWSDTINMYFTGIKETAIGIKAIPQIVEIWGNMRLDLFLNDSLSNVIGLSNLTKVNINSTNIFNYVYFGSNISKSQILPNICGGIYYFGYLFSPILPCMFVYLCYRFSFKVYIVEEIDIKFIYIYASIYCGMILMINSTMILSNIINISMLFYIVSKINKRLVISKY